LKEIKNFEAKNEALNEKAKHETQRANDLQQTIDTLVQENTVLREMQDHVDEADQLEKKITTLESTLAENKIEMDAIIRKCDNYKAKASEAESAALKLTEQLYNRELDEDAKTRRTKAEGEAVAQLREFNTKLFEEIENYKIQLENYIKTESELKKQIKTLTEERDAAYKQLKTTEKKLVDLQERNKLLINSRKSEPTDNQDFTATKEILQRIQNDKAKLEAKFAQALMENSQLHKNAAEQASLIAQLRSEVAQTQQLLVTPRVKQNSIKGSLLSELRSTFPNILNQMTTSNSSPSNQLSGHAPVTASTTRTSTDITELTPERHLRKQPSEVSEPQESESEEEQLTNITSRKEDMGTKPIELVNKENEDSEIQDIEDSKMEIHHDSLLRNVFKWVIHTLTSTVAKQPFVVAATTITAGEVIDSWMSLFNVNVDT